MDALLLLCFFFKRAIRLNEKFATIFPLGSSRKKKKRINHHNINNIYHHEFSN